jgi:hypothetical protein
MTASIILTLPVLPLGTLIGGVCFRTASSNRRNGFVPVPFCCRSYSIPPRNTGPPCALALPCKPPREQIMKFPYFAYLAFVGVLSFLILIVADRERKVGVDRLAEYRIPHSALEDPSLKLMSTDSSYMRTER